MIPEIKRSDNKFMTKRSKLENLLGSIRNKLTNKDNINNNTIINKHSETIRSSKNTTKTLAETKQTSFQKYKIATDCSNKRNEGTTNHHPTTKTIQTLEDNKTTDRNSESTEEDYSFLTLRDKDILNDLENMDIPVQENENNINDIVNSDLNDKDDCHYKKLPETLHTGYCSNGKITSIFFKTNNSSKSKNAELDNTENNDKNKHQKQRKLIEARRDKNNKTNSKIVDKVSPSNDFIFKTNLSVDRHCTSAVNPEDNSQNEDSDIQKLTITSIEKISSPTLSDIDNSSGQEFDTISESNLKFIEEDISSLNSGYSSSDSKNLNDVNCYSKEVTCRRTAETTFIQNEKDFESVEKIPKFKIQKTKDKEYMTVYKIISCEDVTDQVSVKNMANDNDLKNIEKSDVFKKILSDNNKANERTDFVKGNLNSFYKKCKSTYHRKPKSTLNNIESELNKNMSVEQQNSSDDKNIGITIDAEGYTVETTQIFNHDLETDSFCRSCETSEKSIVISDQNIVKYCLKCSCIFESENCSYCDKKAEMGKKTQQQIIKNIDVKPSVANNEIKFLNSV